MGERKDESTTAPFAIRRVRPDEWERVRDLRLEAVSDPDAAIAFLTTREQELARDDGFWRERAAGASEGGRAAQFVAETDGEWVGTATVLVHEVGSPDHLGHATDERRADVVGVYLRPARRGAGIIDALLETAAAWSTSEGFAALTLDVHVDNHRARAAYARAGFVPSGIEFFGPIGSEIQMVRVLDRTRPAHG